jgi:hypothetical protein
MANIQGETIIAYIVVEGREWKRPFPTFRRRMSKSWWKRYARHLARLERREMHRRFWWTDLKARCHLKDLSVDGKVILKLSSKNKMA